MIAKMEVMKEIVVAKIKTSFAIMDSASIKT